MLCRGIFWFSKRVLLALWHAFGFMSNRHIKAFLTMKKLFIFIAFALVFQHAHAQLPFYTPTPATLSDAFGSAILVEFNGYSYAQPTTLFQFPAVLPGNYPIRVWRLTSPNPYCQPVPVVAFDGYVALGGPVCNWQLNGAYGLVPCPPAPCSRPNWPGRYHGNGGWHGHHQGHFGNWQNHPGFGYNDENEGFGQQGQPYVNMPAPLGMPGQQFDGLLGSIQLLSFEATKLSALNTALTQHRFTAQQLSSLMGTLSFESSKLDFAKQALGSCTDPGNYYLLNNGLRYESSIEALNNFVAMR